jgi:hypothetical protein
VQSFDNVLLLTTAFTLFNGYFKISVIVSIETMVVCLWKI